MKTNWAEHALTGEEGIRFDVGPLQLICKFSNGDFLLGEQNTSANINYNNLPKYNSSGPTWTRWPIDQSYKKIRLRPVFPDKPILVRTKNDILLNPDAETEVFIHCPLWAKIDLVNDRKKAYKIKEIPTIVQSDTWFGTYTDGVFCYWLSSEARSEIKPDPDMPHMAICPIRIENKSSEVLKIEKICFRVDGLSLYNLEGQLWSDVTSIVFRGLNRTSKASVSETGPPGSTEQVSKPRDPGKTSYAEKVFTTIHTLPGYGFLAEQ